MTSPAAEHDVAPDSVYPLAHTGVHDLPAASVPSLQLPFSVPRVGLPVPVAKDTVQSFTQVAAVRIPVKHDVVLCPAIVDSEYPSLHAGTHDSPVASAVTAPQLSSPVPALPLTGFDMSVHVVESAVQTTFVSVPSMQLTCSVDFSYPALHSGVHASPYLILPLPGTVGGVQVPLRPLAGVTYTSTHLWLLACATLAPHRRRATAKCLAHGEPPRNMRVDFWPPPFPRSRRRARARDRRSRGETNVSRYGALAREGEPSLFDPPRRSVYAPQDRIRSASLQQITSPPRSPFLAVASVFGAREHVSRRNLGERRTGQ